MFQVIVWCIAVGGIILEASVEVELRAIHIVDRGRCFDLKRMPHSSSPDWQERRTVVAVLREKLGFVWAGGWKL